MAGAKRPGEFELIARYFRPLASATPAALALGDDAALIPAEAGTEIVATADALVAGVHFLPEDPPDLIARKMLRVNLSDLAGMGARPLGYLMTLALPGDVAEDWLRRFAEGLGQDQKAFGIGLLGGDTTRTPGPTTLSVTALGQVRAGMALRRKGARIGDAIWVSGTLGDAALALRQLKGEIAVADAAAVRFLTDRYRLPQPRLALGQALVEARLATAGLDVSDGLVADLGHLCAQSGVAALVDAQHLPLSAPVHALLDLDPALIGTILGGGDDYELVFTADPAAGEAIDALARRLGLAIARIGRIEAGTGVRVRDAAGREIAIGRGGYRHF